MKATDHKIEITESGLAFCVVCKGGEIELEESCASRVARFFAPTPPAGAEPSPEAKAASIPTSEAEAIVIALMEYDNMDFNDEEQHYHDRRIRTVSDILAPLRAELERVKGELEKERDEAKEQVYEADRAEAAANLWNQLADFGGEDVDAQLLIESALEDYTKAIDAELNEASECIVERDNKVIELSAQLALANAKAEDAARSALSGKGEAT